MIIKTICYKKCDRCGGEGTSPDSESKTTFYHNWKLDLPGSDTGNVSEHFPMKEWDLCDECFRKLLFWFFGERNLHKR